MMAVLPLPGNALIRFHGNLNDFITPAKRKQPVDYHFKQKQSIKDACEAIGIPHCEIHYLTVNDKPDLLQSYLKDKSKIDIYPNQFADLPGPINNRPLRPRFNPEKGFILDVHLGKLSRLLRALGLDVYYDKHYQDPEICEIASRTGRLLLTRDIGLLKRKRITYGHWVRSKKPETQLIEVVTGFTDNRPLFLFSRCLICNCPVEPIEKKEIVHRLQPKTRKYYHQFSYCRNCDKIYWQGTHFEKMKRLLLKIVPASLIRIQNEEI